MRTQIFTDKELEELDCKLQPLSPQNLVEMIEAVRRKHYSGTPEPELKCDFTKPHYRFTNYQVLYKHTGELNEYLGRPLFRPQTYIHLDYIVDTQISLNINVREAVILQDKEARGRRKSFLYKIRKKILGQKHEDAEIERLFLYLNTPTLAKSLAEYNWGMANMAYYPREMNLHAKIRKTTFDIKTGKQLEDLVF